MSAVYDRHEYIKDLTGAGLNEAQAEAIAKGAVRVQQSALATKEDIGKPEKDIARLEAGIVKLENRLIKWVVATAGIVVALIKLLPAF